MICAKGSPRSRAATTAEGSYIQSVVKIEAGAKSALDPSTVTTNALTTSSENCDQFSRRPS